jgi:hypothetical protein
MNLGDELRKLGIDASPRVLKRAQYEALEFSLYRGSILVRNASHANPSEHEYQITVQDGRPVECSCPADANYEGACKHRTAVALRRPILTAAQEMRARTDGGRRLESSFERGDPGEDCACKRLREGFPCWECVRTAKRRLPSTQRN